MIRTMLLRVLGCGFGAFLFGVATAEAQVPDIRVTPTSVVLPETLPGDRVRASVSIDNVGDADLVLGEVHVLHPDFTVGGPRGGIPPGTIVEPQGSRGFDVSVRTGAVGTVNTELVVPSNDPDEPELRIPVSVEVLPPPIAEVFPASLSADLGFNETDTQALTIFNRGSFAMDWALSTVPAQTRRGTGSLEGVEIIWDRSRGQIATTIFATWLADLEEEGATIRVNTRELDASNLAGASIFVSLDASSRWDEAEREALAAWVQTGGNVVLIGDRNSTVQPFNDVLDELGAGIQFTTDSGSEDAVTSDLPAHPLTEGVSSISLGIQVRVLDVASPGRVVVNDLGARPIVAAAQRGAGRVVAMGDEILDLVAIGQFDNRQFGRNLGNWLAGATWLTPDPRSGTIAPGDSSNVDATFDTADLGAGTFNLLLRLTSNAINSSLDVPVTLVVTGTPDIEVVDELDFGSQPIGSTTARPITVHNVGLEPLVVTSVDVSGISFSSTSPGFTVPPEDSLTVSVQFTPDVIRGYSGTLTFVSNDPLDPEVVVTLRGNGRVDCDAPCPAPSVRAEDFGGSVGIRFGLDILLENNPLPISSFGYEIEYDRNMFAFDDSSSLGTLTSGFIFVNAQENQPGVVTAGGIINPGDPQEIPVGSSGSLQRIFFRVVCDTCSLGTVSEIVVRNLLDDVETLNACCGRFTLGLCSSTGDVNVDERLTPEDAQCAMKIFFNEQIVPEDCDVGGTCEAAAADVDCNGTVTPSDALSIFQRHLEGGGPDACFAEPLGSLPQIVRFGAAELHDEVVEVPLDVLLSGPSAFGVDLTFDPSSTRFLGLDRSAHVGWASLEAREIGPGRIRVAGFGTEVNAGEAARLRFSANPFETGISIGAVEDAILEGRDEVRFPASVSLQAGLRSVGPVPTRDALSIAFATDRPAVATRLTIYSVTGRAVRTLVSENLRAGVQERVWDGRDDDGERVAAGVYLVRLEHGDRNWTSRAVLLR